MLGCPSVEELLKLKLDIDIYLVAGEHQNLIAECEHSGKVIDLEVQWKRKDGSPFWVQLNWHAIKRSDGATEYFEGFVRDITEERHAKEALRASEERYRELFDNAKDAIYVHDLSGRYVSLNRAAEKLSGYSRDEIIGKHFSNFVAPKDLKHVRNNLCKKLDVEGETTYEIDLVTKDRRRVPVEVVSRLIYENGQPVGVQGTARDMTERKRAQEALQIYSRRLIEAQEAERQSLARELHDEIGQVLTAVRINLQTVQNSFPTDACLPRVEESIVIVDEALARIGELSLELRPSLLDDLGLAAALRWYVDRYGQRTGIVAEVLNGFEERGRLPRDLETECFRIAQEALTNVARHAQATRVSVQVEGDQEKLVLTITDNGTGFDTDNLLTTASSASTLGLRGMKERALAMNGHIEIESSPGKGTNIRASFPLKRRN
jgi:PAS domain S-box-containing protein